MNLEDVSASDLANELRKRSFKSGISFDLQMVSMHDIVDEIGRRSSASVVCMADTGEFGAVVVRTQGSLAGTTGLIALAHSKCKMEMEEGWKMIPKGNDRESFGDPS
jgi:hypothetical protein